MKPAPFLYRDPRSLEEALELLDRHRDEAVVLAGGQSLIPLMNLRLATPEIVIDVNGIEGLDGIGVSEDGVVVGALARASTVERDPRVAARLPVLREALRLVGHPQIRNRTTVGGSLAHADPAAELPALLAALGGEVVVSSLRGQRSVGWTEWFRGPFMTARSPDEMVTAVRFSLVPGMRFRFLEVARRHGDFALAGACVGVRLDDGVVAEARIALCGVGGTPVRPREAEAVLAGAALDGGAPSRARDAVMAAVDPPEDVHASAAYRRHVGAVLVARAVRELWEEARR